MDDTRKWFEYFFNSKEMRDSSGAIKQGWIDFIGSGKAYEIWKACQSLNDKRIQQLLAVIEAQRCALKFYANAESHDDQVCCGLANWSGNPNESPECCGLPVNSIALDNGKLASEALAIKPENVELVEVGYISDDGQEVFLTMGTPIDADTCGVPVTKLYTIKTKEST